MKLTDKEIEEFIESYKEPGDGHIDGKYCNGGIIKPKFQPITHILDAQSDFGRKIKNIDVKKIKSELGKPGA